MSGNGWPREHRFWSPKILCPNRQTFRELFAVARKRKVIKQGTFQLYWWVHQFGWIKQDGRACYWSSMLSDNTFSPLIGGKLRFYEVNIFQKVFCLLKC